MSENGETESKAEIILTDDEIIEAKFNLNKRNQRESKILDEIQYLEVCVIFMHNNIYLFILFKLTKSLYRLALVSMKNQVCNTKTFDRSSLIFVFLI
jgi:hypothetical protein